MKGIFKRYGWIDKAAQQPSALETLCGSDLQVGDAVAAWSSCEANGNAA